MDDQLLQYISTLMNEQQRCLVGRICARIEEIQNTTIVEDQKIQLIKNSIKNYIPEFFRDTQAQIRCFRDGKNFIKMEIIRPTTK